VHEVRCRRLAVRLPSPVDERSPAEAARQFVLHDIHVRIDRDAAGRIRAQGLALDEPIHDTARAVRLKLLPSSGSGVATELSLETGPAGVAAAALAAVVPGFDCFGDDAVFAGTVQWSIDRSEPQGVVTGRVLQTEIAGMLPASSPHRLRGRATVDLAELKWRGSRIERLAGSVISQQAAISESLVEAAVTNFRCGRGGAGRRTADDPAMIGLDYLGVHFNLNDQGLTFWGACPPELSTEEGCIGVSGDQPLLVAPRLHNWHVGWLVQTALAPPSGWLPATREAVEMAERLPLPVK
jgi:hypothetical protein